MKIFNYFCKKYLKPVCFNLPKKKKLYSDFDSRRELQMLSCLDSQGFFFHDVIVGRYRLLKYQPRVW